MPNSSTASDEQVHTSDVPAWEIAAAIALLGRGMLGVVWIAGKIYRVGILSNGKNPPMGEFDPLAADGGTA